MAYEYGHDCPFEAYITNLGKYNEGELVGEWVFQQDVQRSLGVSRNPIDRKRWRRLAEKKQAQGYKRDDREQVQGNY